MQFLRPLTGIKCVLSIIESYSIEKNRSKLAKVAEPPSPFPHMVRLTVKYPGFFDAFPKDILIKILPKL